MACSARRGGMARGHRHAALRHRIVEGSRRGLQLSTSAAFGLNNAALERTDLMQIALGREARTINMVELGQALNMVNDPPVKALFVYSSNPAAVCPNHNDVIRGLLRPDLFTVVHEQFFTDTTDYADWSCRQRLSSSTKNCNPPTGTTTCRRRTRPSSRWANAVRM